MDGSLNVPPIVDTSVQSGVSEVPAKSRVRIEPYIYRIGRNLVVRLARVSGGGEQTFAIEDDDESAALNRARRWRDARATPAMQAAIRRVESGASKRATTLAGASRTKSGKAGIRVVRGLYGAVAFDVTCARPGDDVAVTRRFSIERYGEQTALLYAVRQRLTWEQRYWEVHSRIKDEEWALLVKTWVSQHPGQIFNPELIDRPGTISDISRNSVQARIRVRGELHTKTFSAHDYASAWEARIAAIVWLLGFVDEASRPKLYTLSARTGKGKRDGVSKSVTKGRRGVLEVIYQVSYKDPVDGRTKNKKFNAGAKDKLSTQKDEAVARAARAFRLAYEAWVLDGSPFDPAGWSNWRSAFGVDAADETLTLVARQ